MRQQEGQPRESGGLGDGVAIKDQVKAELGYDSDLVVDSDDEKRLDALPELKREQEIAERRRQRERQHNYECPPAMHRSVRRRTTTAGGGAAAAQSVPRWVRKASRPAAAISLHELTFGDPCFASASALAGRSGDGGRARSTRMNSQNDGGRRLPPSRRVSSTTGSPEKPYLAMVWSASWMLTRSPIVWTNGVMLSLTGLSKVIEP